jgi:hypothetical protein
VSQRRFEIEDSRRAPAAPDVLLARILTPETWPDWQSEILSVAGPPKVEKDDVVRGRAKLLGFEVEGHSTTLEVTSDSYLEDVIVGVRMRVRYSVAPNGSGSMVTHRLESELPRGIAGSILAFLLRRRLRRMQARLLEDLVRQSSTDTTRPRG